MDVDCWERLGGYSCFNDQIVFLLGLTKEILVFILTKYEILMQCRTKVPINVPFVGHSSYIVVKLYAST